MHPIDCDFVLFDVLNENERRNTQRTVMNPSHILMDFTEKEKDHELRKDIERMVIIAEDWKEL